MGVSGYYECLTDDVTWSRNWTRKDLRVSSTRIFAAYLLFMGHEFCANGAAADTSGQCPQAAWLGVQYKISGLSPGGFLAAPPSSLQATDIFAQKYQDFFSTHDCRWCLRKPRKSPTEPSLAVLEQSRANHQHADQLHVCNQHCAVKRCKPIYLCSTFVRIRTIGECMQLYQQCWSQHRNTLPSSLQVKAWQNTYSNA